MSIGIFFVTVVLSFCLNFLFQIPPISHTSTQSMIVLIPRFIFRFQLGTTLLDVMKLLSIQVLTAS
jgi:hypothetical protein